MKTLLAAAGLALLPLTAVAQQLDLSHGGPIDITATDGIDWRQEQKMVVARGDARAVRGDVTVLADTLTAWYRPKAGAANAAPAPATADATDTGGSEIYKVEALGHVRILSKTDQVVGDKAVYDIDQGVLVMTGSHMKLNTPSQILTARDTLEYWSQQHMAVARGDAVALTNDGRRIAADTLVAYTNPSDMQTPAAPKASPATAKPPPAKPIPASAPNAANSPPDDPLAASGKLQKMEAFGHVSIRTQTDTVTGDRGVYVTDTGIARLLGHVRITRGQNQLNGTEALVNMKTGVATLVSNHSGRVHGLVLPNDQSNPPVPSAPPGVYPPPAAPHKP